MKKYRVAATYYCGSRHKSENQVCQDAVGKYVSPDNDLAVVAVADGAGSRRYASQSAQMAVKSLCSLFADIHSVDIEDQALLDYLYKAQSELNLPHEDLGTTLLFVAVSNGQLIAGHIGDGVILHRTKGEAFRVFSEPENGEFSYQTFFLPTSDRSHFRIYRSKVSAKECFLLASDGVSDLLYDSQTQKGMPVCQKIDAYHRSHTSLQCEEMLEETMRNLFSHYSSDDMSIAVLSVGKS